MKSWRKPTDKLISEALGSVKDSISRQYLFSQLKNPLWIKPLDNRGYFKDPPEIVNLPNGYVQYPSWPELQYLKNVAKHNPEEVIQIILRFPKVNNPSVYSDILDIALQLPCEHSTQLKPKVLEYAENDHQFLAHGFIDLLIYWRNGNKIEDALDLAEKLIYFVDDPQLENKKKLQEKNQNGLGSILHAIPRLDAWGYQEILKKGVRPLAEHQPFQVARILIDATDNMLFLHTHQGSSARETGEDYSEVWCRILDKPDKYYEEPRQTLIHVLIYTCKMVYEKTPHCIPQLDDALRSHHWLVFKRIRQHLYARNPSKQTKLWIRELILTYADYARYKYHYEFQQMVRCTCEHFGVQLLTEKERTKIFDEIISGPSRKEFRARLAEWNKPFTKDAFRKRQRVFHRLQFRPFASVLFGKYSTCYHQLENELGESVSDDDYFPVGEITSGSVSFHSPMSSEDLAKFNDKELLDYINSWQDIHHKEDDWLIEINIQALAGEFGNMFKSSIIPVENRLNFWLDNRVHIQRPVYVRAMVNTMQECVKENELKQIDLWLDFCKWVLTHPDQKHQDGTRFGDESCENPNWHTSRRAVGDFVEACLKEDVGTPISVRDKLADILRSLCTQFDWHLSEGELVVRNDPLTDAINTIRGRALESLIKFGFWVRRNSEKPEVPEISTILDMRLDQNAEHPLTSPEYAILGLHYCHIVMFNREWAQSHKVDFFPQNTRSAWRASFGAFIKYGGPSDQAFNEIKSEYIFALQHLAWFSHGPQEQKDSINEFVSRLGQHLLNYYLWGMYPLKGKTSLLEILYKRTKDNPDHWKNLFHYAGYSLQHTGTQLNEELKNRIIEFFNWRLAVKEPRELEKFVLWLEAECLSAEWRLNALSEVLDVPKTEVKGFLSRLSGLTKMLEDHPEKVVECFANMTDKISKNNRVYINYDEGKKILSAGLTSSDENTHAHAERALDKLLRSGHFDFTQLVK